MSYKAWHLAAMEEYGYPEFCSLFGMKEDTIDDDEYCELIVEAIYSGFPDMDYKKFIEYWSSYGVAYEISKERYSEAIEKCGRLES